MKKCHLRSQGDINKLWSGFHNDKIKLTHNFLVDFSLKWPEKVEFSIPVIIENCAWGQNVSKMANFQNDTIFPHRS